MLNSFLDKFIFTNTLKYTHNNFYIINVPILITPTNILTELAKQQNPQIDKAIYYSTKKATINTIKELKLNFTTEKEKSLKFMLTFFTATGWGKPGIIDINPETKTAIITATNTPIATNQQLKYPCDSYLRGMLAGTLTKYFKKEVECVEAKCIATNNQKCEFIVKPIEKFNFENELTRRQLELRI